MATNNEKANVDAICNSDIPFTYSRLMEPLSPPIPSLKSPGSMDMPVEGTWEINNETEAFDDWFADYINMENIDVLNSSATEENQKCIDSMAYKGSDNEETSERRSSVPRLGVSYSPENMEGLKKRTAITDIDLTTRHYKSVSMDGFIRNVNFADASTIALSSPGETSGQPLPATNSIVDDFSFEIDNGKFSDADLCKIRKDEKLAEIARTNPKRAKRMLSNRQSAAQSKERKKRYIEELEHKMRNLEIEATTMYSQVNQLQRDSDILTSKNNELKFRLQAMKQQAQLQEELNNRLASELEWLKHTAAGLGGDNSRLEQVSDVSMYPFDQQQQSNGNTSTKADQ